MKQRGIDMSHKVYDGHGRWRNKHVTFHMSAEEAEELKQLEDEIKNRKKD